jgi:acetyl-CoA carboxylase carboxyltransferase component
MTLAAAQTLAPVDRLRELCDPGSLHLIRTAVMSRTLNGNSQPGDGIVTATGMIDGRPVVCYSQDARFLGGSLGEAHADSMLRALRLAGRSGVPVIGLSESGGARMHEGVAALGGYARVFRQHVRLSGRVPQISVVTGTSAGGGSYSPALTDFTIMSEKARMFLTGPTVVREVMGEDVTADMLGGVSVHRRNGVCDFVAADDVECLALTRKLLGYLPDTAGSGPPLRAPRPPVDFHPDAHVPPNPRLVYDVRAVLRCLVDDGELLEVSSRWAPNIVTALARIQGRPVGFVANQPAHLGGVIDVSASQKGARFIRTCSTFGLPLVAVVDTPGFLPGIKQEAAGIIRHGADLLRAFAQTEVLRLTVILRKAFGGAYITMNSKDLGADLTYAWPGAEIGVMGAQQAVGIINRRELERADDDRDLRAQLAARYAEEHLRADVAARSGFIDEVIAPNETRDRLVWALAPAASSRFSKVSYRDEGTA